MSHSYFVSTSENIALNVTSYLTNNRNYDDGDEYILKCVSIAFAALFAIIFLVGISTNLLVIGVFVLGNKFRQFTNYFFINLSIADILVLLICIPIAITDLFSPDEWNWGEIYCKWYHFCEYLFTSVSSFTIMIISFERYYAITKPLSVLALCFPVYQTKIYKSCSN